MRTKDVIYLGTVTETLVDGEVVRSTSWAIRFVRKLSVRSKEYYEARAIQLKPELMFEIRSIDYSGQVRLKYSDVEYEIIRTYDKGEITELICSRMPRG